MEVVVENEIGVPTTIPFSLKTFTQSIQSLHSVKIEFNEISRGFL